MFTRSFNKAKAKRTNIWKSSTSFTGTGLPPSLPCILQAAAFRYARKILENNIFHFSLSWWKIKNAEFLQTLSLKTWVLENECSADEGALETKILSSSIVKQPKKQQVTFLGTHMALCWPGRREGSVIISCILR